MKSGSTHTTWIDSLQAAFAGVQVSFNIVKDNHIFFVCLSLMCLGAFKTHYYSCIHYCSPFISITYNHIPYSTHITLSFNAPFTLSIHPIRGFSLNLPHKASNTFHQPVLIYSLYSMSKHLNTYCSAHPDNSRNTSGITHLISHSVYMHYSTLHLISTSLLLPYSIFQLYILQLVQLLLHTTFSLHSLPSLHNETPSFLSTPFRYH